MLNFLQKVYRKFVTEGMLFMNYKNIQHINTGEKLTIFEVAFFRSAEPVTAFKGTYSWKEVRSMEEQFVVFALPHTPCLYLDEDVDIMPQSPYLPDYFCFLK